MDVFILLLLLIPCYPSVVDFFFFSTGILIGKKQMTPGENTRMKERKKERKKEEKKKRSCTYQYKRNQKEKEK